MAIDPSGGLTLVIPGHLTAFYDRLRFAELVREKVRRAHNVVGAAFREGEITEAEWETYKKETFSPRNHATTDAILALRAEPKDAVRALSDQTAELTSISLVEVFKAV